MSINIEKQGERQFKSLTGLSKSEFKELSDVFSETVKETKQKRYNDYIEFFKRKPGNGAIGKLETGDDKLFFLLFYLKVYPTYDVMGFVFNMTGKNAHRNVTELLSILEKTLKKLNVLPKRGFEDDEQFREFMKKHKNIIIDATERSHHRKKDYIKQKKYYNGKKKDHTVKNTVISNSDKVILFLGFTVVGSTHDYSLLKQEFNPDLDWFSQLSVWIDLGYLGFGKDFNVKILKLPHKKPRKSKKNPNPRLEDWQKEENRMISKFRVLVENAIGGIKRYNILNAVYRNKNENMRDKVMSIAAGIWNLKLGAKI